MREVKITKQMAISRYRKYCEKHSDSSQGKDWCYGFYNAMCQIGLFDVLEDENLLYEYGVIQRKLEKDV